MKSFTGKLLLSAMAVAIVAAPALAQRSHHPGRAAQASVPVGIYPNPVTRSGSADSVESGAEFNVDRGY